MISKKIIHALILIIIISSFPLIITSCNSKKELSYPYNFEKAKKNIDVIYVKGRDPKDNRLFKYENYNTKELDEFISELKNGKSGSIRVTHFSKPFGEYELSYIYELSIINNKIQFDVYDSKSVENDKYKKIETSICDDIIIKESNGMVVYYLIQSDRSEVVLCAIPK